MQKKRNQSQSFHFILTSTMNAITSDHSILTGLQPLLGLLTYVVINLIKVQKMKENNSYIF